MKRGLILAAEFLAILAVGFATARFSLEYGRRTAEVGGVDGAHHLAHSMGLTPEQEMKLKPSEAALTKDLNEIQNKLAGEKMALCRLLWDGSADSKAVDEYTSRIGALEAQQQARVVCHLIEMRDILTPAQKTKFFNAVMRDICKGYRSATGEKKCLCGMCDLAKER